MNEKFFIKVQRVLNEGGKLFIINRKDQELDLTEEYKKAFDSLLEVEKSQLDTINDFEKRHKQMVVELSQIKLQLNKLIEIKNIRDDYIIKKKLYEDSPEGKLVRRLQSRNIKDISAVLPSDDGLTAQQKEIFTEYNENLTNEILKQINPDYDKVKLEEMIAYYNNKYKRRP